MSITEIAKTLNKNNHSVGRYLDNLLMAGQVEMRVFGKAKVFSLSSRVPLDEMIGFADDLIIILDQEARIIRVNNRILHFFKKDRSEFIGKKIHTISFSESLLESFFKQIRSSFSSGNPGAEIRLPQEGGKTFRQKNIPTVLENGAKGSIILLEDITEQKAAFSALRASEEQFRQMAENIQDGLIIKENETILYINQRAEEIFGCTKAELSSMSPEDMADPEDRDRIREIISDAYKNQIIPSDIAFWIRRPDGTRRFISNRITHIKKGSNITLYVVITDMTEWKHAQMALENHLLFLQNMIDTFPNPLFYLDVTGKILGCNSAFCGLIGKTFDAIAGMTFDEIFSPDEAKFLNADHHKIMETGDVKIYSGSLCPIDESCYTITIQKSRILTIDNSYAGIVGLVLSMEKS